MNLHRFLFLFILSLVSFISPLASINAIAEIDSEEVQGLKTISAEDLKKMIDDKQPVLLLDARKNHRGGMLPGAKPMPYSSSDKEIKAILGNTSKDMTIVVYCSNAFCPVSRQLGKRLILLGYKNIYRYTDGLSVWFQKIIR